MAELDILIWITNNLSNPVLDAVSVFVNAAFGSITLIAVSAILMLSRRTRPAGMVLIYTLIISYAVFEGSKEVFQRPRPFTEYDIDILVNITTYSFPSGHSWNAFALATVLAAYYRKYTVPLLALAAFVGFTRMYLFVHYPTDVVAGAAMGILTAMFVLYMTRKYPSLICGTSCTDAPHCGEGSGQDT